MIFYKGRIIKTEYDELDERERLLLLKGICREIIKKNLHVWTQMIDAGLYKTPECDALWHETFQYMDIVNYCEDQIKKLSEQ